jgi:hypothetical protein
LEYGSDTEANDYRMSMSLCYRNPPTWRVHAAWTKLPKGSRGSCLHPQEEHEGIRTPSTMARE